MIWLATFGLSRHHGSELLVGWQWFERLRPHAPLTVIAHRIFDDPAFLDPEDRACIRFVDTGAGAADEVNRRHLRHVYRFWARVRRIVAAEGRAGDSLAIVSPAGLWFLPWVRGLPIARENCFYGPVGAELLPWRPRFVARNLATLALARAWRLCAPMLPRMLAFRYPMPWLERGIGPGFDLAGTLPEVAPPPETTSGTPAPSRCVAVLHDRRGRKNFAGSLAHARDLARNFGLELVVVGASTEVPDARALPRMARADFLAWLRDERPLIVALSYSEGVPSTLLEALLAGCAIRVGPVGGVQWLARFASAVTDRDPRTGAVTLEWDAASARACAEFCDGALAGLVDRIVAR